MTSTRVHASATWAALGAGGCATTRRAGLRLTPRRILSSVCRTEAITSDAARDLGLAVGASVVALISRFRAVPGTTPMGVATVGSQMCLRWWLACLSLLAAEELRARVRQGVRGDQAVFGTGAAEMEEGAELR